MHKPSGLWILQSTFAEYIVMLFQPSVEYKCSLYLIVADSGLFIKIPFMASRMRYDDVITFL